MHRLENIRNVFLGKDSESYSDNLSAITEINKVMKIDIPFRDLNDNDRFKEHIKDINGVNLIGFMNSAIGLGHTSRLIISALDRLKIPYLLAELDIVPDGSNNYTTIDRTIFDTNIVCINPDITDSITRYLDDKRNIGVWAWELEEVPIKWIEDSVKYEKIWTISKFCQDIFKEKLVNKNVVYLDFPVNYLKCDKDIAREHFNINKEKFVFLFVFDYNSDLGRKNVRNLIKVFNLTFKNNDNVLLVLKTHSLPDDNLLDLENENIILINEILTIKDKNILMNISDAYISLHRTEGYGLTMLESIMLEKPLICTNYSGSLDFCDKDYVELVNGKMVKVDEDSLYTRGFEYSETPYWFEPDLKEASKKMLKVYNNIDFYSERASKYKDIISDKINDDLLDEFIENNL
jgi:glycosyltransferase involved in cell wall biosynthesis